MGRPPRPELHEALLEAARAEFAAQGLERARVEDITRRAGVSKGAFYLHFATKEEAFEEILQRFMGAMEDQARRREEAEATFRRVHAGTPAEELRAHQIEFDCTAEIDILETLWRNRHVLAVIEGAGGSAFQRRVSEFRARMQAFVTARMAEKQSAGWIRADLDPALIADVAVGTYESFARRMPGLRERPDLEGWLRSFSRIMYEGILPDAAPARLAGRASSSARARAAPPAPTPGPSPLTQRSRKARR